MSKGEKKKKVLLMNISSTDYYSLDPKVAKYIFEIKMAHAKLLFSVEKKPVGVNR